MRPKNPENPSAQPPRVVGYVETVFDIGYLLMALALAHTLLQPARMEVQKLAGWMALLLFSGDLCHLAPRILAILSGKEARWRPAMGVGKQITSLTMTAVYVLLWHATWMLVPGPGMAAWTAAAYALATLRAALCLLAQNQWRERVQPLGWTVARNLPFVLLGALVCWRLAVAGREYVALAGAWVAVLLSFLFYLPAALLAGRYRMLGMLMLPKTIMYLWLLWQFTQL
ncbi:MAG: hypothetical protein VB087_08660 [Candidatus Limiplasma sp.]|nr:hypothetical protein [Candidatus Limiplasma sp.]MEA5146370.1 hypothetical protein [Candidatus Limiplasma sp.]